MLRPPGKKGSTTAQGLLKELVLTIKPGTLSRNYPTTWAALSDQDLSIRIDLDTPREITVPANGSPEEFFLAQNRDRIARVRKALAPRIAELPLFDFTPADEPAPLSRPQALFATERFVSTLREARARQTDSADAWLIVAELQLEALAPDLEKRLPGLPPEDQHRIIQRLAAHPWFGAHGPLLQLVRKSSPEIFMATLRSLAPELGDVAVRQTILERFRQERFAPAFTRHLALLAESCPASESAALSSFYPELPQEMRGPFVSGLMLSNRAAANTLANRRLEAGADTRETADLASGMASALGRIYSARKLDLNDEERRFFLGAVANLVGKNRVPILENLPRSESLWSALLAAPRADWSPAEQLALLEHAQQLASPEEKPAAIHEICRLFASGSFAERQLELRADHVLGNLSNSLLGARSHQPAHVPILVWLLDQPANSPHARRFGRTAIHLMSGVRMPGLLADPQARALLESARRSPDSSISGKAAELIKAAAEREPSYRGLL